MWIADGWKDYEVLDTSGGEKLERWGGGISAWQPDFELQEGEDNVGKGCKDTCHCDFPDFFIFHNNSLLWYLELSFLDCTLLQGVVA